METCLCLHEHVYTWCQEGWHDISCHVWPRTVPRTVLAVALLREDARAIINLKAIEWVRSLAGHVYYLACPLRCIILLRFIYIAVQSKTHVRDVCVCFDIWVAGNVAGFAQKNMVAHVSADLLLDLFVDLFVELFVHLCVNRFVDLFVYTFVDQTL